MQKLSPKTLYATFAVLFTCILHADPASEGFIASAKIKGRAVYSSCIVTPPVEPDQVAFCTSIYATYIAALQAVNAPLPLVPSTTPSTYSWSPYDVCRYEASHFVFNLPTQPYCPAV